MNKKEIIINTQLALFFETPISRPDLLFNDLNKRLGDIFDQIPAVLPVPNELLDIPVVQMKAKNGIYSCNIARGRVDFFHAGIGKQKFTDIENDLRNEVEKLYEFFCNQTKIKRIGFVTRFFFEDREQSKTIARLLSDDFKKLHDGDTYESFIRYVSRTKIGDYEINNSTFIEKFFARISGIEGSIKGILVTRDFNTIPTVSCDFDVPKIKSFIEESKKMFKLNEIKQILWSEK